MSAATVYRLHSWNRGGPLCGQVSPNGQCNVRYAVDDHGRDVPAWVTCQRCLRLMHDDGADNGRRPVLMHQLITGYDRTDHRNHDGLDNQRSNLRPATPGQNAGNMRPQEGRTSRYKGVSWASDRGKWQAHIKLNRVNRSLGRFDREEDAADAYDRAALEAWGEYAYLNNARMGAAA